MKTLLLVAVMIYIALALRLTLLAAPPVALASPFGPVAPDPLLIAVVLIGLTVRRPGTFALFLAAGLAADLATSWLLESNRALVLIGPYALGYLAAWHTLGHLRHTLIRHHPLSVALAVVVCGAAVHLVAVAFLAIRGLYELHAGFSAPAELLRAALSLLYTAPFAAMFALFLPLRKWARAAGPTPYHA